MDLTEEEIFDGVDLNDSFVLDWTFDENGLYFELEASIWPESNHYETPKQEEFTCYKRARLEFTNIQEVSGLLSKESVPFSKDPDGSIDYGNIDSLEKRDGSYFIIGDFGQVNISGGELRFEIYT